MIKSNVMPLSNVYVLKGDFYRDKDFQAKVRGRDNIRLMLRTIAGLNFIQGEVSLEPYLDKLTDVQRKEYEQGMPCYFQKDKKDIFFGPVRRENRIDVECRCYHTECKNFKICRPGFNPANDELPVVRADTWTPAEPVKPKRDEPYKQISEIPTDRTEKKARPVSDDLTGSITTVTFEPEPDVGHLPGFGLDAGDSEAIPEYKGQDSIIRSSPEAEMLVLAGPGTGKTYSVIEKLKYLVEEDDSLEAENILLLCFTRAAVKEIRERLQRDIETGDYTDDLLRIEIRTFDSFATHVLLHIGVDVTGKDYDQRIEDAVEEINSEPAILENMGHFIVDEIQDLVGVRARLVQTMLRNRKSSCGFTLLGDPLQGIYDYQAEPGDLDAKGLLKRLNEEYADSMTVVQLRDNMRQSGDLSDYTSRCRKLLESGNPDNVMRFLDSVKNLPSCGREWEFVIPAEGTETTGILCRNNGEVLKLSGYLRMHDVEHTVRRRNNSSLLPVWVAELLSDDSALITEELLERINDNDRYWPTESTKYIYLSLQSLVTGNIGALRSKDLRKALAAGARLPDDVYEGYKSRVCVSTVHRSKGREYDNVLVLKPDGNITKDIFEEAKVYYVAVTRAKKKLYTIEHSNKNRLYSSYSNSKRWAETFKRRNGNTKLVAVEVGMENDVDEFAFVDGSFLADPAENQRYIREKIKPGDRLEVKMNDGAYIILHDGNIIGKMSSFFYYDVKNVVKAVYGQNTEYMPRSFDDIYVDKIYSVVKKPETVREGVGEPWIDTGVWYAVSVSGMGLLRWNTD